MPYTASKGISELNPLGSGQFLDWGADLFEVYNADSVLGERNERITMNEVFKDRMSFSDAGEIALSGTIAIAQGTITNPALALSVAATWNDVADTFTAVKVNVTNLFSAADSLLLDLQVDGVSKFSVDKNGNINGNITINNDRIVLTQGTLTDPATMIDGSVTWNDVADTFTAWKLNVTDSSGAAAASMLLDIQYNSVTMLNLRKDGRLTLTGRHSATTTSALGHVFATSDTGNTSAPTVLSINHTLSSGTAGAGMGATLDWNFDSDTTASTRAVRWASTWTTATHATRTSLTTMSAFVSGTETPQLLIGNNQIGGPVGTVAAPSFTSRNDTDTGMTFPTANTVNLSAGGIGTYTFDSAMSVSFYADTTTGFTKRFAKSRGTVAVPTIVAATDVIATIGFRGYDGANYITNGGASIRAVVTGTPALTRVGTSLIFATATDAAPSVLTDRLTINSSGSQTWAITSTTGTREPLFTASVSDAGNDKTGLINSTTTDGTFFPCAWGYVDSISTIGAYQLRGMTSAAQDASDSSTIGLVDIGLFRSSNASDPNNGTLSDIVNRKLLTVRSATLTYLTIAGNGNASFAAGIFEIRNATTAQLARIYETADAGVAAPANYSRLSLQTQASPGNMLIRSEAAGTALVAGQPRILQVGTGPSTGTDIAGNSAIFHSGQGTGAGLRGAILFQQSAPGASSATVNALSTTWQISTLGNLIAGTDGAYDIGASGATRPRSGFFSASITFGGNCIGASTSQFYWSTRSVMTSPADGVIKISNFAESDFSRLQFGGTTSSFPALKRSTTFLEFRDAADGGYTGFTAGIGANKVVEVNATGLGFFTAAPIARPTTGIAASTFAANTSLIANDTATWDSYTIGQVVKALRNIGILT